MKRKTKKKAKSVFKWVLLLGEDCLQEVLQVWKKENGTKLSATMDTDQRHKIYNESVFELVEIISR